MNPFVVIMGVSGCGKTTIANRLAEELDGTYLEGDSFHTEKNKEKMGSGTPLTDRDRWPWFDNLIGAARSEVDHELTPVLSCSALKEKYREYLFADFDDCRLVYLKGNLDLVKSRMDERDHEYMTSTLLKSQYKTLQEPQPGPQTLIISIEESPDVIVSTIIEWLD